MNICYICKRDSAEGHYNDSGVWLHAAHPNCLWEDALDSETSNCTTCRKIVDENLFNTTVKGVSAGACITAALAASERLISGRFEVKSEGPLTLLALTIFWLILPSTKDQRIVGSFSFGVLLAMGVCAAAQSLEKMGP